MLITHLSFTLFNSSNSFMFFILSKTLDVLLLPYTWILALAVCAIFLKNKAKRKTAGIVLILFLFLMGNTPFVNYLMTKWEMPPQSFAVIPDSSTAIILTGVTLLHKKPYDRVYFSKGADRVTQAVALYRKGKIKQFVITGGSGNLLSEGRAEAHELKKFLQDCLIPDSIIYVEDKAKNTHQNALYSQELILNESLQGPFLLITSAFHMNRSMACYNKVGLNCIPFPVDYNTTDQIIHPVDYIIPEATTLAKFSTLTREISGYMIYKLMGYI